MQRLFTCAPRSKYTMQFAACLVVVWAASRCESAMVLDEPELTKDESIVKTNVKQGKPTTFDANKPGVLKGTFLRQLLANSPGTFEEGPYIEIENAMITGSLELSYLTIKPFVSLKRCQFEKDVDLSWSVFSKGLNLSTSKFSGSVSFRGLEAHGPFRCRNALFMDSTDFRSLRVNHVLDVSRATFQQEANFAYSRIASMFYCQEAVFSSNARFDHMRIEGDGDLAESTFCDRVSFRNTRIGSDFLLDSTNFKLDGVTFNGEAKDDTGKPLIDMTQLEINGMLTFSPDGWPNKGVRNLGFRFSNWSPRNLDPLELLKGAEFDPELYTNLENLLRARGRVSEADRIGKAKKSADRSMMKWYSPFYWWSILLSVFVGDGYEPGRAILWSVGIVLFGIWVFRPAQMVPRKDDATTTRAVPRYSAIWYSLDLFLPGINLESTSFWVPDPNSRWLLVWMRSQRMLGWLVVPIGLLAVSGLMKP